MGNTTIHQEADKSEVIKKLLDEMALANQKIAEYNHTLSKEKHNLEVAKRRGEAIRHMNKLEVELLDFDRGCSRSETREGQE